MRTITTPFLLLLCLASCYKEDDYDRSELDPAGIITEISSSKPNLLANNADKAMITVRLPDDAKEGVDITFATNKGVFTSNGTAQVTVRSKVVERDDQVMIIGEAELKNGLSTGTIHVEATVAGASRAVELGSLYNYPVAVNLSAASLALSNNPTAEVELGVQLVASSGTVTQGHAVDAVVYDSDYVIALGTFRVREDRSDATGKCRFVYSLVPDSTYTGTLHVIATSATESTTIKDTLNLYAIH